MFSRRSRIQIGHLLGLDWFLFDYIAMEVDYGLFPGVGVTRLGQAVRTAG